MLVHRDYKLFVSSGDIKMIKKYTRIPPNENLILWDKEAGLFANNQQSGQIF